MTRIRLYLDEDSVDTGIVGALRLRGIDVRTTHEEGMASREDIDQLRWATVNGRVLYSFNASHFSKLHTEFLERGETHAGIVLARQQLQTLGDQLRGVLQLVSFKPAEEMQNTVEFLSRWIRRSYSG